MLKKTYILLWLFGTTLLSPLAQATPTVQFNSATYSVDEDGTEVTITVTISETPNNVITVDYNTSDGTATEGEDYANSSGTLRWDLFDGSDKTITVTINDDQDIEGDETFNLTLENPTGGATIGDPAVMEVTIIDNDGPIPFGTLQFSSSAYGIEEDKGLAKIIVSRVNGSNNVVSVKCISEDGTAKAGKDYTRVSGTLTWSHGDSADKTCSVAINDDEEREGNETFSLHLKNPTGGAVIGDPSTAVVTIIDNEEPIYHGTFKFSKAEYSVDEGNGNVELKVSRVYGSDGPVTVDYTSYDGTAKAGKDYASVSNTLNWKDGDDSEKTITISIIDDTIDEKDEETFIMALSNPTGGATLGIPNSVVVTIIDDDEPIEPGILRFSEAKYSQYEDGKTVVLPVTRTKGNDGTISVECISSDGTATAGEDYISVRGQLDWGDGDTVDKYCIVSILDDTFFEGNQTFNLKLKNPTGGAKNRKPKKAVVTIIDDDEPPSTLQFSSATYSVDENGGALEVIVSRVGSSKASVKVVTSNGTAKKNKDYEKTTENLTWNDGDNSDKTFTVGIFDDAEIEDDETFYLKLKKAKGAELGNPKKAVVTIIDDDDDPPGTLQFSNAAHSVYENGGLVEITVTRINGNKGAASVKVITSDGTTQNGDYEKINKDLMWDDGDDSARTFTVAIFDDFEVEGDETFDLKLENAEGAVLGNPKKAEVTIIDDDESGVNCSDVTEIPTIECEALVALYRSTDGINWTKNADWNVTNTPCNWEGVTCNGGHVSKLYLYSNNLNGEIPPELGNLTGLERLLLNDNMLNGALPFELGNLSELIYLWLEENNLCGEIPYELMNTNIPSKTGYLKLDDNYLIVDVLDDLKDWLDVRNPGWDKSQEECPVESNSVQFVQGYYDVYEDDGSVILKVSRSEGNGAISIRYATADSSAEKDEDYEEQIGTLSWVEGDFEDKEIQITINNEGESEKDETFNVELSNPSGGAILGTPKRAVVKIIDVGNPIICDEVTEIPTEECNALIALYDETNGKKWVDNTGWKETNTPCQWAGVTCEEGQVSLLYLHSNNLNGEIPSELSNLSKLKRLLLSENELSGAIPAELGDLEELKYLWLHENFLCGNIPDTLRETSIPSQLGYLKLDDNHLETNVSEELEIWLNARNPGWEETQTDCPAPSVLQFSKSMYSVNENKGSVFLTVTRTGSSEGEVSVVCATSDDSAIAGYDYNEIFKILIWGDGDSRDKVCQIDILDDNDLESNETFIVGLGYPDGAELGTPNTAVVIFIDDE
jgi:ribosomal protein L35AE/L33A